MNLLQPTPGTPPKSASGSLTYTTTQQRRPLELVAPLRPIAINAKSTARAAGLYKGLEEARERYKQLWASITETSYKLQDKRTSTTTSTGSTKTTDAQPPNVDCAYYIHTPSAKGDSTLYSLHEMPDPPRLYRKERERVFDVMLHSSTRLLLIDAAFLAASSKSSSGGGGTTSRTIIPSSLLNTNSFNYTYSKAATMAIDKAFTVMTSRLDSQSMLWTKMQDAEPPDGATAAAEFGVFAFLIDTVSTRTRCVFRVAPAFRSYVMQSVYNSDLSSMGMRTLWCFLMNQLQIFNIKSCHTRSFVRMQLQSQMVFSVYRSPVNTGMALQRFNSFRTWECDLVDLSAKGFDNPTHSSKWGLRKREQEGYYILTLVNVDSRLGAARFLPDKSAAVVRSAFLDISIELLVRYGIVLGKHFKHLNCDNGNEFAQLPTILHITKREYIMHGAIESFNKSLCRMLFQKSVITRGATKLKAISNNNTPDSKRISELRAQTSLKKMDVANAALQSAVSSLNTMPRDALQRAFGSYASDSQHGFQRRWTPRDIHMKLLPEGTSWERRWASVHYDAVRYERILDNQVGRVRTDSSVLQTLVDEANQSGVYGQYRAQVQLFGGAFKPPKPIEADKKRNSMLRKVRVGDVVRLLVNDGYTGLSYPGGQKDIPWYLTGKLQVTSVRGGASYKSYRPHWSYRPYAVAYIQPKAGFYYILPLAKWDEQTARIRRAGETKNRNQLMYQFLRDTKRLDDKRFWRKREMIQLISRYTNQTEVLAPSLQIKTKDSRFFAPLFFGIYQLQYDLRMGISRMGADVDVKDVITVDEFRLQGVVKVDEYGKLELTLCKLKAYLDNVRKYLDTEPKTRKTPPRIPATGGVQQARQQIIDAWKTSFIAPTEGDENKQLRRSSRRNTDSNESKTGKQIYDSKLIQLAYYITNILYRGLDSKSRRAIEEAKDSQQQLNVKATVRRILVPYMQLLEAPKRNSAPGAKSNHAQLVMQTKETLNSDSTYQFAYLDRVLPVKNPGITLESAVLYILLTYNKGLDVTNSFLTTPQNDYTRQYKSVHTNLTDKGQVAFPDDNKGFGIVVVARRLAKLLGYPELTSDLEETIEQSKCDGMLGSQT